MQLLDVGHYAEATLGVGMVERISDRSGGLRHAWPAAGSELEQGLGGFRGQALGQHQQAVLIRTAHIAQPFGGHAIAQQFAV